MQFSHLKLRHILTFLEVARLKSVALAADKLAVTQPAVSKSLKELEAILDVALFDRSHRSLKLTRSGETLVQQASVSIGILRQALETAATAVAEDDIVRIGALPTVVSGLVPEAINALHREGLRVPVRIVVGENHTLLSQLRLGELDMIVGSVGEPELMIGLTFEHLYSERIGVFVRHDHPLTFQGEGALKEILDYPIILPQEGSLTRPLVDRFMIANGIGPLRHPIETQSISFSRSFTSMSDAAWIVSSGVVDNDVAAKRLVELPVVSVSSISAIGLMTQAGGVMRNGISLVSSAIRTIAGSQQRAETPSSVGSSMIRKS